MDIILQPIGFVRSKRTKPEDYKWGHEISRIELDSKRFTEICLLGLSEYSHLQVVFLFHKVDENKIETGARFPRENPKYPKTGIFAQRGKNRPNRLGVSPCRLIKVEGLSIEVEALDAIDGSPILDIKPYVKQFDPRGEFFQPKWIDDLMSDYFE